MVRRWIVLGGMLLGIPAGMALAAFWPGLSTHGPTGVSAPSPEKKAEVWTCSMHPQIRMDHPDVCPICGMDLTPVGSHQDDLPADRLTLGPRARMMARVETAAVQRRELRFELRSVGRVDFDETRMKQIAAWIDGRVDEVFADFPGTNVRQGEHLVKIYSPDLYTSQYEFLLAYGGTAGQGSGSGYGGEAASSARRRLELWGITPQQIDELARTRRPQTHLTIHAPIGGTVITKNVRAGQYVKKGDMLYTIADLSQVWLVVEVYESELSWVRQGQSVQVYLESQPQQPVTGTVAFIEPVLNEQKRTVEVRVVLDNPGGRFKPGMYAQARLQVPIAPDGGPAPTGLEGKYVCPMHPHIVSENPGNCSVCRMPLEKVPGEPAKNPGDLHPAVLAVPAEAVLTTGRRQLVYVERQPGEYQLVEPKLGPRAGDWFPVHAGLQANDRVVVRGNFLLDSQFQVTGKPSLLYPQGSGAEMGHGNGTEGWAEGAEGKGTGLAGRKGAVPFVLRENRDSPQGRKSGQSPGEFGPRELANLERLPPEDREAAKAQGVCPVTGLLLGSMGKPVKVMVDGRPVFLCCKGCVGKVKKDD